MSKLYREFPAAKQQWFEDDGSSAGKFADVRSQYERLQQLGPNYRYFPESLTSILVVALHNVEQAKGDFAGLNFQGKIGSHYLSSFVGKAMESDS